MMSASLVRSPSNNVRRVLDTWPVMEWLKNRPETALRFDRFLERVETGEVSLFMSDMTLGEIYYSVGKVWGVARADEMLGFFDSISISILDSSRVRILAAARLKAIHNISYADAFVAGLANELDCPIVTGDPDFAALAAKGVVEIEWLGA